MLALLFLEAVILRNLRLEKPPIGVIFGIDYDAGFLGLAFLDLVVGVARASGLAKRQPDQGITGRGRGGGGRRRVCKGGR